VKIMTLVIVPRCPRRNLNGRMCAYPAGAGTRHRGWGVCRWHRGQWTSVEKTWEAAMELAEELDINPLEALLQQVRSAGAHAAWADTQLREAIRRAGQEGTEPGDEPTAAVARWLMESRKERALFSKISKAAVDAGVATALLARIDMESTAVAEAVIAGVDALDLPGDARNRALAAAHERLLAISGPAQDEILQIPEAG
jgi:hypothetical protein